MTLGQRSFRSACASTQSDQDHFGSSMYSTVNKCAVPLPTPHPLTHRTFPRFIVSQCKLAIASQLVIASWNIRLQLRSRCIPVYIFTLLHRVLPQQPFSLFFFFFFFFLFFVCLFVYFRFFPYNFFISFSFMRLFVLQFSLFSLDM